MLVDSGCVTIYNDLVSSHLHPFMLTMFPGYEELLQEVNSPSPSCVGDKKNWFQEHLTEFYIFYWIPHSPDLNPISAFMEHLVVTPNKHSLIIVSPRTCLNRHTHSTTPVPHRHSMLCNIAAVI